MPEGAFSRDLKHNGMMGIDLSRYAVELCVCLSGGTELQRSL